MKNLILLFLISFTCLTAAQTNKEVIAPFTESAEGFIDCDQRITYQINFQNTGNGRINYMTILDTLDEDLDIATLKFQNSSHLMIPAVLNGNVLRFNLPSIQLPDSNTNEPESHGFVVYSIKPKLNLPPGTLITNFASIYFETDPKIVTNTTLNTILTKTDTVTTSLISLEEKFGLTVFPNPFDDVINVEFSLQNQVFNQLNLFDISGRTIYSVDLQRRNTTKINTTEFPKGVYFYEVMGEETLFGKLIKR